MSRRVLAVCAAALVVAGIAFVVIGHGGSAKPATATAGPATQHTAPTAAPAATMGHGPALAAPGASTPTVAASSDTDPLGNSPAYPEPQVAPEMAARAVAIGGGTAPGPTGTAIIKSKLLAAGGNITAQRDAAMAVLATNPKDVNALRVVVSASCATNDVKTARKYNSALPPGDQAQMATACHASGVELADDHAGKHWAAGTVPPAPTKTRPPQ